MPRAADAFPIPGHKAAQATIETRLCGVLEEAFKLGYLNRDNSADLAIVWIRALLWWNFDQFPTFLPVFGNEITLEN